MTLHQQRADRETRERGERIPEGTGLRRVRRVGSTVALSACKLKEASMPLTE